MTRESRLQSSSALVFAAALALFATITCAQEPPTPSLHNVGYQVLEFGDDASGKPVTVAVWYPTDAPARAHRYGGPTKGQVAADAVPLADAGPYPLLVFSHGYGSSGIGSVFFTERMAAHGWIVAAPDHNDRHSSVRIRSGQLKDFDRKGLFRHAQEIGASGPEDRGDFDYRLNEMRLVIDGMLASEEFGGLIDDDRLAVGGHSFGGFTALAFCGTLEEYHDPRVKALLLFSTGAGGYLYTKDELGRVEIPALLFLGEREKDQLRGGVSMTDLSQKIFGAVSSSKYLLEVKGASHFSFNNRFSRRFRTRFLAGTEKHFNVIRRYSIAFLETHVSGNTEFASILEHDDKMLTRHVSEH